MRIILVRHGQTTWNKEEIFRGRADIPLDKIGLSQARAVARRLQHSDVKRIYSSPLKRAFTTAQAIGKQAGVKLIIEKNLIEFDCGVWQGLSLREVKKRFPTIYARWSKDPYQAVIPKAEKLGGVRIRIKKFLRKTLKTKPKGDIVIVSHRIINKILLSELLSLPDSCFWKIKQDVGAISIVDFDKGLARISSLNDTCHLRNMAKNKEARDF